MQVDLKIIKDSVCKSYFMSNTNLIGKNFSIDSKIQLCAGKLGGDKGTCQGDSGTYTLKSSFIKHL